MLAELSVAIFVLCFDAYAYQQYRKSQETAEPKRDVAEVAKVLREEADNGGAYEETIVGGSVEMLRGEFDALREDYERRFDDFERKLAGASAKELPKNYDGVILND
ncbi:Uncharacterised protein [Candidatus Norongarragalina meridionalis]|nr:Uncharacterised protein [Candidatus Norongarragalina meridionalis]